jgi:hypothetical protein
VIDMLIVILLVMGVVASVYTLKLLSAAVTRRAIPDVEAVILGATTNFFDTLGIGSFAPTMVWFKIRRLVPDRLIPSTMLVGHTLPAMAQAILFLVLLGVFVDARLLIGCLFAVFSGAIVGAPIAARMRVEIVQTLVGVALIIAAITYALTNLHLMPGGGTAASLPLPLMFTAIAANFVFGVLLNFGIGNYAPTLIMLSLMGMDPRFSFPIMTGGAALA